MQKYKSKSIESENACLYVFVHFCRYCSLVCKGLSVSEKEAKLKQKGIQVRKPKPKNWWIQQTNEKKVEKLT